MTSRTLIDGRQVDGGSTEWRDECLARWRHVQAVLAMRGAANRGRRAAYIERVAFLEGVVAGERLRAAVATAWAEGAAA